MRQIAVVCAMGAVCAVLVGCDNHRAKNQVDKAQVAACADADDAATKKIADTIRSGGSYAYAAHGEFHDILVKAVNACQPILPAFQIDSPDPAVAQKAKICKNALDMSVQAYRRLANGVSNADTINLVHEGLEESIVCHGGERVDDTPTETVTPTDDSNPKAN